MSCCGKGEEKKRALVEFVPTETAKARLEICRPCEKWLFGMCLACGCNMFLKTKLDALMNEKVDCTHPEGSKWKEST